MELNLTTDSSILTSTQSFMKPNTTSIIIYNERLFLHTVLCQTIAGAFTWAAILITGYHVKLFIYLFC
jgi:hypothetical protein